MVVRLFLLLLMTKFTTQQVSNLEKFYKFRDEMQKIVEDISKVMEQKSLQSYKECPDITDCNSTIFNEYQGILNPACDSDFPEHNSCTQPGVVTSLQPAYRLPPEAQKQNLTCREAAFICNSLSLEDQFFKKEETRNNRFTKMYVGSITGAFVSYPGIYEGSYSYDPRVRPWYTISSAGQKNTFIYVDLQQSEQKNEDQRTKDLLDYLVETSNWEDYVQVIDANSCDINSDEKECNEIAKATPTHKKFVKDLFAQFVKQKGALNIEKFIHFLGIFRKEAEPAVKTSAIVITNKNTLDLQAKNNIFEDTTITSILIEGEHNEEVEKIACQLNTAVIVDDASTYVPDMMKPYFNYFSKNLSTHKPTWTRVYEDKFGFGDVVTVGMSVVVDGQVVAVSGLDVPTSYINKTYNLTKQNIVEIFGDVLQYKKNSTINWCENTNETESNYSSILKWGMGEQSNLCCRNQSKKEKQNSNTLTQIKIPGIIVGIAVFIAVVGYILYWRMKKKSNMTDRKEEGKNNEQSEKSEKTQRKEENKLFGIVDQRTTTQMHLKEE